MASADPRTEALFRFLRRGFPIMKAYTEYLTFNISPGWDS